MTARRLLPAGLVAAALLALGCAPPWHIVAQAAPDPFLNQRKFAVAPIEFADLHVGEKSEAEYLAEKDAKQRESFAGDKAGINEEFAKALISGAHDKGIEVALATGPADAPFLIHPVVGFVEPGFYAFVAKAPSKVNMIVRITTPDGKVLDEITVSHGTQAPDPTSIYGMAHAAQLSSGGRLRADGEQLGGIVAKYLQTRVAPK